MAYLNSGVLVKLLNEMGSDHKNSGTRKSAVLQIRSIVPLLEEGNLWPNQGFLLKVSDLSHAAYVSLPEEHNEMILNNQLQLGQFICVQKLEEAHPVPILSHFTPLPSRHPCVGFPSDLVSIENLVIFGGSDSDSSMENRISVEKRKCEKKTWGSPQLLSPRRAHSNGGRRTSFCNYDKNSDSDSPRPSSSFVPTVGKRSSSGMAVARTRGSLDSPTVTNQHKTISRTRSAPVSPALSARYYSFDDNSSSLLRRKYAGRGTRSGKSDSKSEVIVSRKNVENLNSAAMNSSVSDRKWAEMKILWDSLPSPIVKPGKEMVRHRDAALQAAVEALQEASAAERLIKCLSTYSQLHPTKGHSFDSSLDKFLNLQDDLDYTKLILRSLTNLNLPRSSDADADVNTTGSIKEALKLAFEGKKNATSWIKEAMASNLSPFPSLPNPNISSPDTNKIRVRRSSTSSHGIKPMCPSIASNHRKAGDSNICLAADEKEDSLNWVKGAALTSAGELANMLQNECTRRILVDAERYLDGVEGQSIPMESDCQIGGVMCQIKRVSDWLDVVVGKENGCKDSVVLEEAEAEACRRVKNKIFGVLLKHVERTAMGVTAQGSM